MRGITLRSITTWIIALALALSLTVSGASADQSASGGDASISISKKAKKAKKKAAKKAAKKRAAKRKAAKKRRQAAKRRAERRKKPQPKVVILDSGQTSLTGKGIKLRVVANKRMHVSVAVKSTSFDEGETTITKPRVVKFRKKNKRVITIPLTADARTAAATCAARKISASGQTRQKVSRDSADMERQLAACELPPVDLGRPSCDFIAKPKDGLCMLPFPNDYYTRDDASSPTGKRIDFKAAAMPRNAAGAPIDPSDYLASDGFSQGQGILLKVPGIDTIAAVDKNGMVPLDHLSRYSEADQKAVVIDTETGERWPIWVQIDSNADDPAKAALMISPAVNFDEKKRYVVALRNLTDVDGTPLAAPDAFRYYRDDIPSAQEPVNARRDHFEGIFKTLKDAGLKRSELYLAWDFTVASDANGYERALHMRDDAFRSLGDTTMADKAVQGEAPAFKVTSLPASGLNSQIARRVRGTYKVPCYLDNGCQPGGLMDLDSNGLPQRIGSYNAKFECIIPPVGLSGGDPPKLRPFVYGHGLLGAAEEVRYSVSTNLTQDHAMIACATDEIGMASEDVGSVIGALNDLSNFPVIPDRLQQGLLNELFLVRLMYHEQGFGTDPAFQDGDGITAGDSVIRTDHAYYVGASQGGIMGGPLTAISPDFTQSALVVGGMNYSTLLNRSSNWPTYELILGSSYPDELERLLALNLIQMLWDRGEPNGYAHRMTDNPPPNTPKHNIALILAVGDHQVANITGDIQARTAGFKTNRGTISEQRWPNYEELWNVPRIQPNEYPYRGSSIHYFDAGPYRTNPDDLLGDNIGTGPPPIPNVPPNGEWEDPHGAPRGAAGPIEMMDTFLQPDGFVEDLCGPDPCVGSGWDGDFSSVIPSH